MGSRAGSKPGSQFQITVHSPQSAPYCLLPPVWTSLFTNHSLPARWEQRLGYSCFHWAGNSPGTEPVYRCMSPGVPQPVGHLLLWRVDSLVTLFPETLHVLLLASLSASWDRGLDTIPILCVALYTHARAHLKTCRLIRMPVP